MRKSLTVARVALLALVLVGLVTATWAGHPQGAGFFVSAPVELVGLVQPQPVEFITPDFVPIARPTATALLRGPPSSGLVPPTTRILNQEAAWPGSADLQRSLSI